MKKEILLAVLLAQLAIGGVVFAKHRHSSSGLSGTWRNDRTGETMTIAVNGDNAILTFSSGSPDSGTLRGNTIAYQGVKNDHGMLRKVTGTLELSATGNTLIKRRTIYDGGGTRTETVVYTRQ